MTSMVSSPSWTVFGWNSMPSSCGGVVSEFGSFGSSDFLGVSGLGGVDECWPPGGVGCDPGERCPPVTALTSGCSRR